jgi:ThiF family
MLSDAQIERYSRQILLPEVGGRGQERLLAARVALAGTGDAAAVAATLLGRAGIGHLGLLDPALAPDDPAPECRVTASPEDAADADVIVDLAGDPARTARLAAAHRPHVVGIRHGRNATVLTLLGRPCGACVAIEPGGGDAGPLAPALAVVLGAAAAAEGLRLLLVAHPQARRQMLGLDDAIFRSLPVEPARECRACGEEACGIRQS